MCVYKINDKLNLKSHTLIHTRDRDSGERRFSCDICNHKTNIKSNLKSHTLIHTRDRSFTSEQKFSCDICNHKTNRKFNLKSHMLIHTGDLWDKVYPVQIIVPPIGDNVYLLTWRLAFKKKKILFCMFISIFCFLYLTILYTFPLYINLSFSY